MLGFFKNGSGVWSQTEQIRSNIEINDQRHGIDDGRNEGACHYGGVKPYALGDDRKGTADKLCHKDG